MNKDIKYPHTYHLPWSESITKDDKILKNISIFRGKEVVVTEKFDGENTTMTRDNIHARSLDSGYHISRTWVKNLWGQIHLEIPIGWRLCGENLYAKHSIYYDSLRSYFLLFSVWNSSNICLSWDATIEYTKLLGLELVPTLWRGIWNEKEIKQLHKQLDLGKVEGYVVRLVESFPYREFSNSTAKFVREKHIKTDEHWMTQEITRNKLNL